MSAEREGAKPGRDSKPFDSFADRGKIVIVTHELDDMTCKTLIVEHHIYITRAKEIIAGLQDAVRRAALNTQE